MHMHMSHKKQNYNETQRGIKYINHPGYCLPNANISTMKVHIPFMGDPLCYKGFLGSHNLRYCCAGEPVIAYADWNMLTSAIEHKLLTFSLTLPQFADTLKWTPLYFSSNNTDVWSHGSDWQAIRINSGNYATENIWQGSIWTHGGLVIDTYMRHSAFMRQQPLGYVVYVSLGPSELTLKYKWKREVWFVKRY